MDTTNIHLNLSFIGIPLYAPRTKTPKNLQVLLLSFLSLFRCVHVIRNKLVQLFDVIGEKGNKLDAVKDQAMTVGVIVNHLPDHPHGLYADNRLKKQHSSDPQRGLRLDQASSRAEFPGDGDRKKLTRLGAGNMHDDSGFDPWDSPMIGHADRSPIQTLNVMPPAK
jgi:hypothetical protein